MSAVEKVTIRLCAQSQDTTFYPQHEYYANDRIFFDVRGDVRHQSKILDQAALFTFRSVGWAEHTKL